MLQLILMLLGIAFSQNNANTSSCNHDHNNGQVTTQSGPGVPGTGLGEDGGGGPGNGGSTGGNTGQNPPPFTNP